MCIRDSLKTAFEDGSIALAKDSEHTVDLRLIKVVRGIPMVPDERVGEAGAKRHGDFAVALGLAHFASRMQWHEYGYTTAADQAGGFGGDAADDDDGGGDFGRRAW